MPRERMPSKPIVDFTINTDVPCNAFDSERLILTDAQINSVSFTIEKESPLTECPSYPWQSPQEKTKRRY